jgi:hypothetical protein
LTRAQLAEQVGYYKALAEQAGKAEKRYRAVLTAQAEAEYRQGTAPTWRIPGIGTVSTSIAQDAVVVVDEAALLAWVEVHQPDHVETRKQVAAVYLNALLKNARLNEDGALVNAAGDVVPGLKMVPGGQFKGISFLFADDTKAAYAQVAEDALSRVALRTEADTPGGQPTDAEAGDAFAAFAAFGA